MTPEQKEFEELLKNEKRIKQMISFISELNNVTKSFLTRLDGNDTTRENNFLYKIIERIHYNIVNCIPLLNNLLHSHHVVMPLGHIYRAMIHEVVIGYWLLGGNIADKISILNGDYITKNTKLMSLPPHSLDDNEKQRIFRNWETIAPENFNKIQSKGGSDLFEINKLTRFNFTEVSNGLKDTNSEIQFLSEAYSLLSQQAHLSEFSREIIYNRHAHMTKLLNVASGKILKALICFISEIDTESTTSKELEAIKELYYSKL